jgi:iron complex outermembrane receptor protein
MRAIKYLSGLFIFAFSIQLASAQDTAKNINDTNKLHEVQILGVKNRQAVTVTTLNSADLNRSSGLSLQDALNLVPGVEMQNREAWGGDRIIMRGYIPNIGTPANLSVNTGSGYGYMVYLNNIPITDATGNTIMDDIDNSNIGQVQVIKGPSSSLYGSYIGGSVHLFTPTVPLGTTVQEQVVGGSYGLFRDNTTVETATDKSSIWINYGGQTYTGFRPNDFAKDQFASFAGTFKTSEKNNITTYFSYNYSNQALSGELDSDQVYGKQAIGDSNYDLNFSHVYMESIRGGVDDHYQFNKNLGDELTLFGSTKQIDQVIAHGFTDYQEGNWGGRDAFDFHCGIVNAVLGGSFQKFNVTQNGYSVNHKYLPPFSPTLGTGSDQQNYALNYNFFTQWDFRLPAQIHLMVGGSLNYSEFGIENMLNSSHVFINNPPTWTDNVPGAFTPSAALIKDFGKNVQVYASFGMGYTPPGLSEILTTLNTIDNGLKPESAVQYELGSRGTLLNGKLVYDVALYDLDITNRLVQEFDTGTGFYTNVGEQRNEGVEVYLGYDIMGGKSGAISQIRPWVSYTYDNAQYVSFNTYGEKGKNPDTVSASYTGNKAVGVAPNTINAGLDFATKVGVYLHVTYQYVDKVPFTFDNEHYMSSYSLLNARLGYSHKFGHLGLDAFVGVNNALGSVYYTSVFFAANIQDLAQYNDVNYFPNQKIVNRGSGGDGYILPAPYTPTFYGGLTIRYTF